MPASEHGRCPGLAPGAYENFFNPGDRTVRVEGAVAECQQVAEDVVAVGSDQETGIIRRQHCCVAVVEPGLREPERLRQLTCKVAYSLHIVCRAVPALP